VSSALGSRQGDPFGPLFFAAGLQGLLEEVREKYPSLRVFAYIDDVILVGEDDEELAKCVKFINNMARDTLGLKLRLNKCSYYTPSGIASPILSEMMNYCREGLDVLGSPIGSDHFCIEFCMNTVEESKVLFEFIEQLTKQEKFLVLRYSLDCGINHLLRTTPPRLVMQAAKAFDSLIIECVKGIIEHEEFERLDQAEYKDIFQSVNDLPKDEFYLANKASLDSSAAQKIAKSRKSSVVLIGVSGCGKTYAIRCLAAEKLLLLFDSW
jgi:hypothetical protein